MITLEIPERHIRAYLPEDLSQCDNNQYVNVCALIYDYNCGKIDYEDFRTQAIYKLLNLVPGKKTLSKEKELEKNANIYQLSTLIDNFFEQDPETKELKVIKQNYINNHIPFIQPLWKKYYGPSDAFKNVTFGEYSDAMNIFMEYEKNKDEESLRLLLAIFYRPKRKFNRLKNIFFNKIKDVRVPYNGEIEERAQTFVLLNKGQLYGFYLFFASFHKYLTTAKLYISGEEIDLAKLFDNSGPKEVTSNLPGLGLKSIEYQISESGVFGTNQQVRQTNLWETLLRLYDITKRDADHKAREEEAKRNSKKS